MKVRLTTPPATEPITVEDAEMHLRLDSDVNDEAQYVTELISVARGMVESFTGRALITQTWEIYLADFPDRNFIVLPFGNLQSVTSVTTKNSVGDETVLTAMTQYLVDTSEPGRIVLPYSGSWPSFTPYPVNAVKIVFVCGYVNAAAVPAGLKAALKLILSDLYENRESQLNGNSGYIQNTTAANLMYQYKLWNEF